MIILCQNKRIYCLPIYQMTSNNSNPPGFLTEQQDPIFGLPHYLYYGQNARVEDLNNRIYERNLSDSPLEANFDPRSTPTKYSRLPIVNLRNSAITPVNISTEPIRASPVYQTESNFSPANRNAPFSGFQSNVDKETILRNQTFALQRGLGQDVYVPSSQSDLYKTVIVSRPSVQPYPKLFEQYAFNQELNQNVANFPQIGKDRFSNNTRTQLRGLYMEGFYNKE